MRAHASPPTPRRCLRTGPGDVGAGPAPVRDASPRGGEVAVRAPTRKGRHRLPRSGARRAGPGTDQPEMVAAGLPWGLVTFLVLAGFLPSFFAASVG